MLRCNLARMSSIYIEKCTIGSSLLVGLGHNTFCSCCNSQCMACERTHVDDTSYRRLVVKEKEAW